jgi:hypothetical protein
MGHADASMIAKVYQHLASDPTFLRDAAQRAMAQSHKPELKPKEEPIPDNSKPEVD